MRAGRCDPPSTRDSGTRRRRRSSLASPTRSCWSVASSAVSPGGRAASRRCSPRRPLAGISIPTARTRRPRWSCSPRIRPCWGETLRVARLFVLEWHQEAAKIAAYRAMLAESTEWDTWFCWSDGMVPPFGLLDVAGEPKAEYVAFAAGGEDMEAPHSLEDAEQRADWQLGPRWLDQPIAH